MKIHPAAQGSEGWLRARLGIPTASCFDQIITPKTLKPSSSQAKLSYRLLAEWALGHPIDEWASPFTDRGHELEAEARAWYEASRDVAVEQVGLCLRDDGMVGASPDGLVGEGGLLEVKCLSAAEHVAALLGERDDDHRCQVQGQLLVTGRSWCDLLFFNPVLPSRVVRVERDEAFLGALVPALDSFVARLAEARVALREAGVVPALEAPPPAEDPEPAPRPILPEPVEVPSSVPLDCLSHAAQDCPAECAGRWPF